MSMNDYTVTLTLNFAAETPEEAANEMADWLGTVRPRYVLVTDERTGEQKEVQL